MGEEDIADRNLEESERRIVSQQPYLGSLFKSQNGSTWTPSQFEDLKFLMNKCEFVSGPGALKLYNPELGIGNKERPILRQNPIVFNSQEVKIALSGDTNSNTSSDFPIGSLMKQTATSSQGNVVAHLGKLGTISHQSGTGVGLVNATYNNVPLTTITGNGTGGVATIVISGGTPTVGSVSVTTTGHGLSLIHI